MAVPWAIGRVQAWYAAAGRPVPKAFLVAVDADTVRIAFNKGYARSEELREPLRESFRRAAWLMPVRVPGEENGVDAPSRNKPLEGGPLRATWKVLKQHPQCCCCPLSQTTILQPCPADSGCHDAGWEELSCVVD